MSDYVEEQIVRHEWTDNVDNISYGQILVRCKDCKYLDEDNHECKIRAGWFHVTPDWFCADGERRDDD